MPARKSPVTRPRQTAPQPEARRTRTPPEPVTHTRHLAGRRRVAIEAVRPQVDGGRFPIKRVLGEQVAVSADIHADGHDVLAAVVAYRRRADEGRPEEAWAEVPMASAGNDRWEASFEIAARQTHEYRIEAWVDRFASWRKELAAKVAAGQDVASELVEGAALMKDAAARARERSADDAVWLDSQAEVIGGLADQASRAAAALDVRIAAVASRFADRVEAAISPAFRVWVDDERARSGAWYEMFPRSWGPDPSRSATFREAAGHLLNVAALGFDVVYLPPIHPIGRAFRKGRGHALAAGPSDPGSPWAIGSHEGGHKAIEPGLGTLEDFDSFVRTARSLDLEVALDLAYQCSPDHPYVRDHPEWFRHRPDGTIKYAENPPKKYQDIYPFDFETDAWRELWDELKSIVLFWIGHGIRIFRVDNPHTKPYVFWEWLISEIQRDYPDTIFLSEAFTRPKQMYYLAKLGFTQSYTYFTWRLGKGELTDYFTELTASDVVEYFRPNLFTNTPDILHASLQTGGRPAFALRFILAATLGANYGIYSGFELCEGRAVPGTEEYVDSEKFQFRQWDWERPENIKDLIRAVNRIRRVNPALQYDRGVRFQATDNDHLLAYTKQSTDGSNLLLIVVNLDPVHMQHGWLSLPLVDLGLSHDQPFELEDLLNGARYAWRGTTNYVRLDPADRPAHIFRLR
jgi:starch synthase (maltosyl-transferring)